MGMRGPFSPTCATEYCSPAPAPNPSPTRWRLLGKKQYKHGYVLIVKYLDATNFEGVKCMVYRGKYKKPYMGYLDPHFTPQDDSPIARFRPDEEGIVMACQLARSLREAPKEER